MKYKGLTIGIPKEVLAGERRVAATPETAARFVQEGARVLVQSGAGAGAFFHDEDYTAVGAQITDDVRRIFAEADAILKVKEPRLNPELGLDEIDLFREGQILIAFLHPAAPVNHDRVRRLAERGVTSLTLDSVPRISRAQAMDALTSMSTVAGYKAVISAANRLPKFLPMLGTAVGMIQPAQVLVIGAGVAGLQAVATAKRLGAVVTACDIRPDADEQARSLGAKTIDLEFLRAGPRYRGYARPFQRTSGKERSAQTARARQISSSCRRWSLGRRRQSSSPKKWWRACGLVPSLSISPSIRVGIVL